MSAFFTAENIANAANGRWLQRPAERFTCTGVGIDSRADLAGTAFVAIRGHRHDGHDHLHDAAHAGACMLIVHEQRDDQPADIPTLLVDDTRIALGRLAGAYRKTLTDTLVIAVTGSAGKTTTKSLMNAVLSTRLSGTCAPKSFNNDIGVPLTILSASPADQYLLVEIGTNAPGEIDALAAITQPDIAVITMIGRSHLAGLGSVEAVAVEKASLLNHLRPGGTAILHADSPELRSYITEHTITFGRTDDAKVRLTSRGRDEHTWWFQVNDQTRFALNLPGRHNAVNALAAVAVGRAMHIDDAAISAALAAVQGPDMRFVPQQWRGMTIYNDAYNANPDSMIAALDTFAELAADAPRRVIILGDMGELGHRAIALHEEISRHIAMLHRRCPFSHAIFIGDLAAHYGIAFEGKATYRPTLSDSAIADVHDLLKPGDAVLIKASRSVGLERLLQVETEAEPRSRSAPSHTVVN